MPDRDVIVLDLETQRTFEEVGGRDDMDRLMVSVAGIYSYKEDAFTVYTEHEVFRLFPLLEAAGLIVGFNIKGFDYKVLQAYHHRPLDRLPTLDIMEEAVKALGHRLRLESLARASLGEGKIGTGLDAIRYFRNREMKKLKAYCLEDVKITRDLYEYGKRHKKLLYHDRKGEQILSFPVNW